MIENLEEDDLVRLLMTIPGIGLILAHVIRAEIGEIERFPTFRHLASYAGLAPMSDDTAGREGPRHCSTACNHVLRWAFIEAVHGVQRTKGPHGFRLRQLYARLCGQGRPKGRKSSAKVAVAHELSQVVHVVWTKRVPYTDTPPPRPGSRGGRRRNPRSPTAKTTLRRTSPVTLWSAAGQPSARPVRNWAVRCRIPILCRAGRLAAGNGTFRSQAAAPTRRDSWFYTNREMLSDHTGLSQLDHKLMRRRAAS